MTLCLLPQNFTVAKLPLNVELKLAGPDWFAAKTDSELSLVCPTDSVPENPIAREDGWRGFYIRGQLDFSLIGILAEISAILAQARVGIFVVSTFDTDYIFVKAAQLRSAIEALRARGYDFCGGDKIL